VHAGEIVVGVLGIAGVVLDFLADVVRQVGHLVVGGAAGGSAATAFFYWGLGVEYGEFHGGAFVGQEESSDKVQQPCQSCCCFRLLNEGELPWAFGVTDATGVAGLLLAMAQTVTCNA
jgi:hypothetical protein